VKRHLTAAYAGCRLEAGAGSSASLVISDHQCRRCCEWSRLGKPAARPPCGRLPSEPAGTSVVLRHGGVVAEGQVGSGSENMNLDSQTPSGRCHDSAYVCFGTEPQGTTKGKARCQGLGNEPPSAVLSSQLCCFVQEGTRVQHLKNFRVGEAGFRLVQRGLGGTVHGRFGKSRESGVVAEDASDGWVAEGGLQNREALQASRRRLLRW